MSEARVAGQRRAWAVLVPARRQALLEDVKWMLSDGTTLESAAARLRMSPRWLVKRLSEMHEYEVLVKLKPSFKPQGQSPLIPNGPVVEHIATLRDAGWQVRQIAVRAGVDESNLHEQASGQRQRIREHVADAILAVQGDPPSAGVLDYRKNGREMNHQAALAYLRQQVTSRKDVA